MAKKKTVMQNQVEKDEKANCKADNSKAGKGEQMDLMDYKSKQSKEIERIARLYAKKVEARLALQSGRGGEFELQQTLLELIKAEKLARDNNGKITLKIHGVKLELTPTKEKVKVKVEEEE